MSTATITIAGKNYEVGKPNVEELQRILELKAFLMSKECGNADPGLKENFATAISTFEIMLPQLKIDHKVPWLVMLPQAIILEMVLTYFNDYLPFINDVTVEVAIADAFGAFNRSVSIMQKTFVDVLQQISVIVSTNQLGYKS